MVDDLADDTDFPAIEDSFDGALGSPVVDPAAGTGAVVTVMAALEVTDVDVVVVLMGEIFLENNFAVVEVVVDVTKGMENVEIFENCAGVAVAGDSSVASLTDVDGCDVVVDIGVVVVDIGDVVVDVIANSSSLAPILVLLLLTISIYFFTVPFKWMTVSVTLSSGTRSVTLSSSSLSGL